MTTSPSPLVAPTFLFRFSVPCQHHEPVWSTDELELPPTHKIPSFGELEDRPLFADVRLGWHVDGLAVSVRVEKKKQPPWCRASRLEDSDGLSLFLDTRDTQDIHRASRYCHRFILMPEGGGKNSNDPVAETCEIHRARENPKPIAKNALKIRREKRMDGYILRAAIPAAALTGFDPDQYPRLGFSYAVTDRELGWQTFSVGAEFPFTSDPSLWGSLELVS